MMSELHSARRTDVSGEQPSDPGGADTDRPTDRLLWGGVDRSGRRRHRPTAWDRGPGADRRVQSLYVHDVKAMVQSDTVSNTRHWRRAAGGYTARAQRVCTHRHAHIQTRRQRLGLAITKGRPAQIQSRRSRLDAAGIRTHCVSEPARRVGRSARSPGRRSRR